MPCNHSPRRCLCNRSLLRLSSSCLTLGRSRRCIWSQWRARRQTGIQPSTHTKLFFVALKYLRVQIGNLVVDQALQTAWIWRRIIKVPIQVARRHHFIFLTMVALKIRMPQCIIRCYALAGIKHQQLVQKVRLLISGGRVHISPSLPRKRWKACRYEIPSRLIFRRNECQVLWRRCSKHLANGADLVEKVRASKHREPPHQFTKNASGAPYVNSCRVLHRCEHNFWSSVPPCADILCPQEVVILLREASPPTG
mmetsp:Transcript_87657/g.165267  ORF Transcript_87657/g.165267 Transcript_87657/m.165267 type:complete len:253 (+) Transcript_87657:55-813(+)